MAPKHCKEDPELKRFRKEELHATAYHEAGHAVLYALWGLPFERVEVFTAEYPAPPKSKGRYAGIVRSDWARDCPCWAMPWHSGFRMNEATKHWEQLICIFLAGELAESRHVGHSAPKFVGRHDQRDIRFLCRHLIGCPLSVLKDWIVLLRLRTWKMLHNAKVWQAVTAVAEALLKRAVLTRTEVQALVKRTCKCSPR